MTNLYIKFVNDITFKNIHDLIMEFNPEEIIFEETFEDVDLNELFHYAHLLKHYKPELKIIYSTCRMKYPIEDLSPEFAFREIPFDKVFTTDFQKLIYERI